MKEMSKAKIIDKKSEKSIKYERELLSRLKHPFIVNMQYAFQDYHNLYLVMDLLTGGDLRYHISRHRRFSEEQTKFFVACLILGLEYLHSNNVLHRDIKPENLVLDECGYMRITDFGIAKLYQKENSAETSGTPGYMSPEVMCAKNHTIAVDYFAVGVIGYEFMNGRRPYLGKSRKEIKELLMAKQVQVKEIPDGWTAEAADFINKCLQRKPVSRLGFRGAQEVKDHPWFKFYPWQDLYDKKIESPFIPRIGDNFDKRYCESQDKLGNDTLERYQKYIRDVNFPNVFLNFTCINNEDTVEEVEVKGKLYSNKPTSLSSKLTNSKYNINLLKNKVKIVNSTNNLLNIKNSPSQKIIQNVNNFYNNYLGKVSSISESRSNLNSGNTVSKHISNKENKTSTLFDSVSNNSSMKNIKGSAVKQSNGHQRTNSSIGLGSSSINLLNSKLINNKIAHNNNVSNFANLKLSKKPNNASSNSILLKNYKHNSTSQSSTGSSIVNSLKSFNK